ncbi:MAG: hypothetical protein IKF38_04265 [Clostridia bacterium]|nr:hypothetical protein [Clostridia bacterium]
MKKMIVTIIILFIIFISMVIYRNAEKEAEVKVDEVNLIEEYMEKIYGWKEVTDEALPVFDNINNANEKWIWGTVRENIEDYDIGYEIIENTAKELFGNEFNKQYPKEGTEFISFDAEIQKYQINEITLDAKKDSFLLNKIEKNKNIYTIEIVEYLVDYTDSENGKIVIRNINEENIYELTEEEATESNIKNIVKENMDRFSKKHVILEKQQDNLIIKKVEIF